MLGVTRGVYTCKANKGVPAQTTKLERVSHGGVGIATYLNSTDSCICPLDIVSIQPTFPTTPRDYAIG